ncbi:hypothetical protein KDN32_20495 [Nocardioides sp. J2M5]|uniref:calcium-binding protein n=1 Tax=Nocardioides palaemonis TaxID=2829810 RepID=UPI001BA598F3|nr:calcium-binding protein [Nocardioides palaemonis]MBS2940123.1 hypothetical protein [Nocardioides palaemonis]
MRRTTTLTTLALTGALSLTALVGTSPASAAVTCDGKVATIVVPTPPGEITDVTETAPVTGTPGDDVIVGTEARDTIDGAGGNDTICALGGDDTVRGGEGDDRLFGGLDGVYVPDDDFWGDLVVPGPGDDYVDLGHDPQAEDLDPVDRGYWDQVSFRDATGPVTVDLVAGTATGEGTDTIAPIVFAAGIEGSAHDDTLRGTDKDDFINAGGGDDVVDGRGGDDLIDADRITAPPYAPAPAEPGDDVVHGGPGADEIRAGHGADRVHGDEGRDEVVLEQGERAKAWGGPGRDSLGAWGFAGSGSGTSELVGGAGNDLLFPGLTSAADQVLVRGGAGRDTLAPNTSLAVAPHKSRIVVRVPDRTMTVKAGTLVRFGGIEKYDFNSQSSSARIRWFGSGRAETFDAEGQDVGVRAFGAGGNDALQGGYGTDLLDGGRGRDTIDGGEGRDRCLHGEKLSRCEVRR